MMVAPRPTHTFYSIVPFWGGRKTFVCVRGGVGAPFGDPPPTGLRGRRPQIPTETAPDAKIRKNVKSPHLTGIWCKKKKCNHFWPTKKFSAFINTTQRVLPSEPRTQSPPPPPSPSGGSDDPPRARKPFFALPFSVLKKEAGQVSGVLARVSWPWKSGVQSRTVHVGSSGEATVPSGTSVVFDCTGATAF